MEENLPNRKMLRWNRRDYSSEGKYFITICIKDRKTLLSRISSVGVGALDDPKDPAQNPGCIRRGRRPLQSNTLPYQDLYQPLNDSATKKAAQIFGNAPFTTT